MIIKYYKNKDLAYANRKRFISFNYTPFNEEVQRSVLLGDGAHTSIKTSKNNICDYVKIDETRWFVTSYVYLNGGQVRLNLQRDVVGEFGLGDCYGKIDRGYTNGVLRHKKELGLNQILKKRFPIIPDNNAYGNFRVDNHNKEAWGILYFVNASEIDPNTGKPSEEKITINIPAFRPNVSNYSFIEEGTSFIVDRKSDAHIFFNAEVAVQRAAETSILETSYWNIKILFDIKNGQYVFSNDISQSSNSIEIKKISSNDGDIYCRVLFVIGGTEQYSEDLVRRRLNEFAVTITNSMSSADVNSTGFLLPEIPQISSDLPLNDYNGAVLVKDGKFYRYSVTDRTNNKNVGQVLKGNFKNFLENNYNFDGATFVSVYNVLSCDLSALFYYTTNTYHYTELTAEESGSVEIPLDVDFVDEPYIILAVPLFDVNISSVNEQDSYSIDDKKAFNVFNSIIEYLSGDNPYIIDAQIYPYCPPLSTVASRIADIPIFSLLSTNYETKCSMQLLPYKDVKKEYIERMYSIVSPDQSAKTSFNFYDYKNTLVDGLENDINYSNIEFIVKTALKPFSIISSCYPIPDDDAIIGIDYKSKLSGCKSAGNGFQASMASSAFETFRRQNSNYQQIFQLEKDQLIESHKVEKANEIVSAITGTASVTAMGAITGGAMADFEFFGMSAKGAGAAIGASTAAATVGSAYAVQAAQNEKLRDFERRVQQQMFDLEIGTVKNLPLSVNRISTFNEIILKDFYYVVELYECTDEEKNIVDNFVVKYSYSIGVYDYIFNYIKNGWFIKANLITSSLNTNLFNIASDELLGGIYYYE